MNKRMIIWALLVLPTWILAQQEIRFSVQLSGGDTIGLNEYIDIQYKIEGTDYKDFQLPDFNGFYIASGPYQSTSISYVNGLMTRETTYIYRLVAKEKGTFLFPPASILVRDELMETREVEITVVEDGIARPKAEDGKRFKDSERNTIPRERFKDKKIYSI